MNRQPILPKTEDDMSEMRSRQLTKLKPPTYAGQKLGIILSTFALLIVIALFIIGVLNQLNLAFAPLLFVLLFSSHNMFSQFSVRNDGIISGGKFIAWKNIQSFEFVRIDVNHRNYGHSKEINDKYELKIKTKFSSVGCLVLTDEMKEKLTQVLKKHIS